MKNVIKSLLLCVIGVGVVGCGSGGKRSYQPPTAWQKGIFLNADIFANYCAAPRTGVNPYTQKAYPDIPGNSTHEKHFLRSWTHEDYLWYDELPDLDPNAVISTPDYFDLLQTSELTANNTPKDKFHFAVDEEQGDQLVYTGETGGFGINWTTTNSQDFYVAYVEPNSPAALAGVGRGMLLRSVGNFSYPITDQATIDAINEVLGAPIKDKTYQLGFSLNGAHQSFTLTATNVTTAAVYDAQTIEQNGQKIGYLAFNTFQVLDGEFQLKEAFDRYAMQGINELVLDLRYNGGGFLYIAAQLAYQVAGSAATQNKVFAGFRYNNKRTAENENYPFYNITSEENSRPLSSVNLNRVYVITTGGTCSASEAVINGLRGIGVEVIQIGTTTCGKPHGFNAVSNCGVRYYSIDFEYVNHQGFSGFEDGFRVSENNDPLSDRLPGCVVDDDFSKELGNTSEKMLATALHHIQTGSCPSPLSGLTKPHVFTPKNLKLVRPASHEVLLKGFH